MNEGPSPPAYSCTLLPGLVLAFSNADVESLLHKYYIYCNSVCDTQGSNQKAKSSYHHPSVLPGLMMHPLHYTHTHMCRHFCLMSSSSSCSHQTNPSAHLVGVWQTLKKARPVSRAFTRSLSQCSNRITWYRNWKEYTVLDLPLSTFIRHALPSSSSSSSSSSSPSPALTDWGWGIERGRGKEVREKIQKTL